MLSRTSAAFQFTAERLAAQSDNLYFWTFTFKSVPIDDNYAMEDYATLMRRLQKHFEWCQGVRVSELHRSHGIHFHCILNSRIPIDRVKRICYGNGHLTGTNRYLDFGRMSVAKCDSNTIGYLGKYLTKQYRRDNEFWGRRRWGCIGGFEPTRCREIEYDTSFHRNYQKLFNGKKIDYVTMLLVSQYSQLWGELHEWPNPYKMRVMNFNTSFKGPRLEYVRVDQETKEDVPVFHSTFTEHRLHCRECARGYGLCTDGWCLWQRELYQRCEKLPRSNFEIESE